MSVSQRHRKFEVGRVSGQQRSSIFQAWAPYDLGAIQSFEKSDGFTNPYSNGRWLSGGDWHLSRDVDSFTPKTVDAATFTQGGSPLTVGTARISEPTTGVPLATWFPNFTNVQLAAMGTSAIAATEPTQSAFDLATLLGELRAEGIPNVPGASAMEATNLAKKAGGEYLNVEFGWLPLVRGIRDFASTVNNSDRILRDYQEGSGKVIQRSYDFPEDRDSKAAACSFSMYPSVGFFTGGGCSSNSFRKTWFECEYIYHIPTGTTINDKFRRYGSLARKLLGVELSPEILWNLSPWSWAADWVANTGDVMHNISAMGHDGLVLRHGYIMSHAGRTTVYSGAFKGQGQVRTHVVETKTRRAATPYGFGVSYDGLNPTQKAVLIALGLSRW